MFQCLIEFQEHLFHQVINSHRILRGLLGTQGALTFEAVTTATFLLIICLTPATHTIPHPRLWSHGELTVKCSHSIQLSAGTKAAWAAFCAVDLPFPDSSPKVGTLVQESAVL